jgi:hypothetical protein
MSFFNEKWNNSSILTKVAAGALLLSTILLFICAISLFSWNSAIKAATGVGGTLSGLGVLYLIIFFVNALLTFGIIKVNRFARSILIIQGLGAVIAVIIMIAGSGYLRDAGREVARQAAVEAVGEDALRAAGDAAALGSAAAGLASQVASSELAGQAASAAMQRAASSGLIGKMFSSLINLIPKNILAKIGFYLFVFTAYPLLQALAMLLLLFCGKDFKKIKKTEAAVAVYCNCRSL